MGGVSASREGGREKGGKNGGKKERPGQAGREEGGGWEIGSGEEEVERTVPESGSKASLYKIYTFLFPPSSFHGNIPFPQHHLLNRVTLTTPTPAALTTFSSVYRIKNKICGQ